MHDYLNVIKNVHYVRVEWVESQNSQVAVLVIHDLVGFPFFAEQYESFVKFTQDQIMRRYGARPASCKYLNPCFIRDYLNSRYGLILNDPCVFQTSPELASKRPQLPLTIWLLFYFFFEFPF